MASSEAEPGDVILVRDCWIEAPDGEVSPLTLRFTRPVKQDDEFGQFVGTLHIECKHFTKVERLAGEDGLHVLCMLLWIGRTRLEIRERDGYSIWWREKGGPALVRLGRQHQEEFCLPSAMTEARRDAFHKANDAVCERRVRTRSPGGHDLPDSQGWFGKPRQRHRAGGDQVADDVRFRRAYRHVDLLWV